MRGQSLKKDYFMSKRPIIGIPADKRMVGIHPFHMVGEKYLNAIKSASQGLPWIIPALGYDNSSEEILERIDGLFLTGSYSDIEPHHYGGDASRAGTLHDPDRDKTVLPLAKKALDKGVPVFAVCRGFQELNVLLGGTLHQHIHEIGDNLDHRENKNDDIEEQYGFAHEIKINEGSMLHQLYGKTEAKVNSLHGQGIKDAAPGITIEAVAEDGVIEAFRVNNSKSFAYAVQWHPEWKVMENPLSLLLFREFGDACKKYAEKK